MVDEDVVLILILLCESSVFEEPATHDEHTAKLPSTNELCSSSKRTEKVVCDLDLVLFDVCYKSARFAGAFFSSFHVRRLVAPVVADRCG